MRFEPQAPRLPAHPHHPLPMAPPAQAFASEYAIADTAYTTAVLHAAKHPGAVLGLLLGSESSGRVTLEAALPVAHSALATGTAPASDMALLLARAAAAARGLAVAGVYYAPEVADDGDVPVLPARLADLVRGGCPYACLLLLDARALHPDRRRSTQCWRLCTMEGGAGSAAWGKGQRALDALVVSDGALAAADEGLKDCPSGAQEVIDFEEHCQDPALDWLNGAAAAAL